MVRFFNYLDFPSNIQCNFISSHLILFCQNQNNSCNLHFNFLDKYKLLSIRHMYTLKMIKIIMITTAEL